MYEYCFSLSSVLSYVFSQLVSANFLLDCGSKPGSLTLAVVAEAIDDARLQMGRLLSNRVRSLRILDLTVETLLPPIAGLVHSMFLQI